MTEVQERLVRERILCAIQRSDTSHCESVEQLFWLVRAHMVEGDKVLSMTFPELNIYLGELYQLIREEIAYYDEPPSSRFDALLFELQQQKEGTNV